MQYSISEIARTIVVLYGNSGAGKGVAIEKIAEECMRYGVSFSSFASGDGFRGLFSIKRPNDDEQEALDLMGRGLQVEGIYPIADIVVKKIKEHIMSLKENGKAILCLDGLRRNREDISQISPGKRLPSQGLQLAGMFLKAVKELHDEGNLDLVAKDADIIRATPDQELKNINHDGAGVSYIYKALGRDANNIFVHVSDETAARLMRFRSFYELRKIFLNLATSTRDDDKKNKALEAVNELMLVRSGNFAIKNGAIVLSPVDISKPVKPFEPFTEDVGKVADIEVQNICRQGLIDLIGESKASSIEAKDIVSTFIKTIKVEFGISTGLRADDMTEAVIETRIKENEVKVVGGVYPELGIRIIDKDGTPFLESDGLCEHAILLPNGIDMNDPSKGVENYKRVVANEIGSMFGQLGYKKETNIELDKEREAF